MPELRRRAIATLQESTDLFDQASALFENGELENAAKVQELARSKRSESVWLMTAASKLENDDAATLLLNSNANLKQR